jgi:hypothetical protein
MKVSIPRNRSFCRVDPGGLLAAQACAVYQAFGTCLIRIISAVTDFQERSMSDAPSSAPAPDALELAALLCSRVCHDLISPVGAIVNGLEVLDDNPKP